MADRKYVTRLTGDNSELLAANAGASKSFETLAAQGTLASRLTTQGLGALGVAAKQASESVKGIAGTAASAFTTLAGFSGILSVGSVAGLFALASSAIHAKAELFDLSKQTGISVEVLSGYGKVAKQSGTDLESIAQASGRLSKSLFTQNEDSKGAAQAIKALGLNFNEFARQRPDEQMVSVAKALDTFADGSGKSAAAMLLFGRQGAALLPFLSDLAQAGTVVGKQTTESAKAAKDYERNLVSLRSAGDDWKRTLANEMLPPLLAFTTAMLEAKKAYGGFFAGLDAFNVAGKDSGQALTETQQKISALERDSSLIVARQGKGGFLARFLGDVDKGVLTKYSEQLTTLYARKKYLQAQQTREALAGTAGQVLDKYDKPKPQLALKAPDDTSTGGGRSALASAIDSTAKSLDEERVRLLAETRYLQLYGVEMDKAREAVIRFRTTEGDLRGASPAVKADLIAKARADDQALQAKREEEATIAIGRKVTALNNEAAARARSSREDYIAQQLADADLAKLPKQSAAYQAAADAIAKAAGSRFDAKVYAPAMEAWDRSVDNDIAKVREETASLGQGELARRQSALAIRLEAEARAELAKFPERELEIRARLAESIRRGSDQVAASYATERSAAVGAQTALQRYQEEASNSATFANQVVGGSLERLTDALTTFAETGKLKLGGLFKFMADEFIRNWVRMQIAQQTQSSGSGGILGLISAIAGIFGAGGGYSANNGVGYSNAAGISGGRALGGDVGRGSAVVVGEHGPEVLFMGGQGGRVVSNSQIKASRSGRDAANAPQIHIHNNVGAQVRTETDSAGDVHVLLEQVTERAANLGAARGHAMMTADLASGSGQASRALKSRGVNLSGALPKRHGA